MHSHADEICYWAKHPDGTKVWQYEEENVEPWKLLCCTPEWFPHKKYIVDDEWADLRKAQSDGDQLQYKSGNMFIEMELSYEEMYSTKPSNWRIKPKEPVYEWQMGCIYH